MRTKICQVKYGDTIIVYTRIDKKVKNVNLRIRRDASVVVTARAGTDSSFIDRFVRNHAEFILRAQERMQADLRRENSFACETGDKILYMGKEYRLNVKDGKEDSVYFQDEELFLVVKKNEWNEREKVLRKFLFEQAQKIFYDLTKKYYPYFQSVTIFPEIVVKDVRSRWGSCTPSKHRIVYALKLLQKPQNAIEYVVVHELSHFVRMDHSPAFYAVVGSVLPQWKFYKALLRQGK